MKYLKVQWKHSIENCPTNLFSEIDSDRYETRKVYHYSNGKSDFADEISFSDEVFLGDQPVPELDVISQDPQFVPSEISRFEFEKIWDEAYANKLGISPFQAYIRKIVKL